MKAFALIILLISSATFAQGTTPKPDARAVFQYFKPFKSDGCSSSPDGVIATERTSSLAHCCIVHDFAYWTGGSLEDKENADEELRVCISKASGYPTIGSIYKIGVLIGGGDTLLGMESPFPWKWAYGWNRPVQNYNNFFLRYKDNMQKEFDALEDDLKVLLCQAGGEDQHVRNDILAMRFPKMLLTLNQLEYAYQGLQRLKARVNHEMLHPKP